ncbi:hypothetical protein LTR95_011968 [Oleoguttula sp. CCFEE 5521]
MASNTPALSYHEPSIQTLLVLSSFLLLLNFLNFVLNRLLYCGLIGQILLGILYGTPGANWLSLEVQVSVMQLGYIGLLLVVYEGGLSTNLPTLRTNFGLSSLVAMIGISLPVALSFVLMALLPITPLQAFAAGAALCSTSLGTTFTVLTTSGLTESRLGVVLTSAAMMDDVVGLVMVQVISNLGQGGGFRWVTVVRPVLSKAEGSDTRVTMLLKRHEMAFAMHTAVLVGLVTGATYAGTSGLFAAYLAGAAVTWLSDLVSGIDPADQTAADHRGGAQETNTPATRSKGASSHDSQTSDPMARTRIGHKTERRVSGRHVYKDYYHGVVERVLKPFFFASIGFSIPITRMFAAPVVWRGIVYSILMTSGKIACGLCLVRFAPVSTDSRTSSSKPVKSRKINKTPRDPRPRQANTAVQLQDLSFNTTGTTGTPTTPQEDALSQTQVTAKTSPKRSSRTAPLSLYPAAILGSAMVARGEIGFLISAVAESKGIYGASDGPSQLFLIVAWAVLVCTVVGPVLVGLLVQRVKRLQEIERRKCSGREDPLGIWGVVAMK